jgi:hypothetical protein
MSNSQSDDLAAKLRAWKVEPEVPGSFSREVWQRIAARQEVREAAFWPRVVRWFSTELVGPQYATALVILSLSASIGVAHVQAQSTNARTEKMLESRYGTSVDPLAMMR